MRRYSLLCIALLVAGPRRAPSQAATYDVVIANGRVMDPESGTPPSITNFSMRDAVQSGLADDGGERVPKAIVQGIRLARVRPSTSFGAMQVSHHCGLPGSIRRAVAAARRPCASLARPPDQLHRAELAGELARHRRAHHGGRPRQDSRAADLGILKVVIGFDLHIVEDVGGRKGGHGYRAAAM